VDNSNTISSDSQMHTTSPAKDTNLVSVESSFSSSDAINTHQCMSEKVFKVTKLKRSRLEMVDALDKPKQTQKLFWFYNQQQCREHLMRELFAYMKPHKLYDCHRVAHSVFDNN